MIRPLTDNKSYTIGGCIEILTKAPNAAAMTDEPNKKNRREKDVPTVSDSVGMSYMHPIKIIVRM